MASTVTRLVTGLGAGSKSVVRAPGVGSPGWVPYKIAFGNPYAVGGEDISTIWNDFRGEPFMILVQQVDATPADNRNYLVDMTAKKLIMLTAIGTESGAVSQVAVADVRLLVYGNLK